MKIKVCNLHCGIGGNRKLWPNNEIEVMAIDNNKDIIDIYHDFFPNDKIIITDAHQYLINHYTEYDFIWASPPCQTHSVVRRAGVYGGKIKAVYSDMSLYQEIILLMHFSKCKWVIENVRPYYKLLIPGQVINRHIFWSNFLINKIKINDDRKKHNDIVGNDNIYSFRLEKYKVKNKRKILRNMVNPKLGLYIFNAAFKNIQIEL